MNLALLILKSWAFSLKKDRRIYAARTIDSLKLAFIFFKCFITFILPGLLLSQFRLSVSYEKST